MSGITSRPEVGDEEEVAEAVVNESSRRALTEVLGAERRDRILSALYLARQDAVNVVRQSSIHIWKALVHNTPKTGMGDFEEGMPILIFFFASARDFARVGWPARQAVFERRV